MAFVLATSTNACASLQHVSGCCQKRAAKTVTAATISRTVAYSLRAKQVSGAVAAGVCFCVGDHLFLTCYHVVHNAQQLTISSHAAHIRTVCRAADIALLDAPTFSGSAISPIEETEHASHVPNCAFAVARTPAKDIRVKPAPCAIVSRYASGAMLPAIQARAPSLLSQGLSGAPLLVQKRVIGMFSARAASNAVFIPAYFLLRTITCSTRHLHIASLVGLRVQPLCTRSLRHALNIPSRTHAALRVAAGNGSNEHSLRQGDVILGYSSEVLLRSHFSKYSPADLFPLRVLRKNCKKEQLVHVCLQDALYECAGRGWGGKYVATDGTFVFAYVTLAYLAQWGVHWAQKCPPALLCAALRKGGPSTPRPVVLAHIAPDAHPQLKMLRHVQICRVNGRRVNCITDVARYARTGGIVQFVNGCVLDVRHVRMQRGLVE